MMKEFLEDEGIFDPIDEVVDAEALRRKCLRAADLEAAIRERDTAFYGYVVAMRDVAEQALVDLIVIPPTDEEGIRRLQFEILQYQTACKYVAKVMESGNEAATILADNESEEPMDVSPPDIDKEER